MRGATKTTQVERKLLQQLQQEAVHSQLGEPLASVVGRRYPISRLSLLSTLIDLVLLVAGVWGAPLLTPFLPF